jgi:hypothetical protein
MKATLEKSLAIGWVEAIGRGGLGWDWACLG